MIVASSECMLNRQRREKPQVRKADHGGQAGGEARFGVDEDVCTGDHACMRLSGCPSLSVKTLDDPLRDDPVAAIDQSCVGCGNCGEVADAAVLCPSFYRADVVHNPGRWRPAGSPAGGAGSSTGCRPRRDRAGRARDLGGTGMNVQTFPTCPRPGPTPTGTIIKLAILAVGGQGGGVLTDWIVDLAERNG